MKTLIKKILMEQDWWEDVVNQEDSIYNLRPEQLADVLNDFFKNNLSPNLGRSYKAEMYVDDKYFTIGDYTGFYFSEKSRGEYPNFKDIIYALENIISSSDTNQDIREEYQDLYDTLKPLIVNRINESEWWEDVVDSPLSPDEPIIGQVYKINRQQASIRYDLELKIVSIRDGETEKKVKYITKTNPKGLQYDNLPGTTPYSHAIDLIRTNYWIWTPIEQSLFKEDKINEANEYDWVNIEDMSTPKGIVLANIIEEFFIENHLPYYVKIKDNQKIISLTNLMGSLFLTLDREDFTVEEIDHELNHVWHFHGMREYKELLKILQPLFDSLK